MVILVNICTFFDLLKYPLLTIDDTKNEMNTITPARTHYKWTKISSLEIVIFGFKMMMKSGILKIHRAPSEIPANLPGQFSLPGQIFLHWAAATLKGLGEFQNKKF